MSITLNKFEVRALNGGGSLRAGSQPRQPAQGGPPELFGVLQAALEWRNLVRMMWVELGRPPVAGFPASRVQQILWGELPSAEGFFAALFNALTLRLKPRSVEVLRDLLDHAMLPASSEDALDVYERARRSVFALNGPPSAGGVAARDDEPCEPNAGESGGRGASVSAAASQDPEGGGAAPEDERVSTAVTAHRAWMKQMLEDFPRPDAVETEAEFMAALRRLKERTGMSLRQLEERSKETTAGWLPKSSLADMLRRDSLPRADLLWSFTAACGLSKEDRDKWEAARGRLQKQRRSRRSFRFVSAGAAELDGGLGDQAA